MVNNDMVVHYKRHTRPLSVFSPDHHEDPCRPVVLAKGGGLGRLGRPFPFPVEPVLLGNTIPPFPLPFACEGLTRAVDFPQDDDVAVEFDDNKDEDEAGEEGEECERGL